MSLPAKRMTKQERDDLLRLVRGRERVLKHSAEQRSAELLAEFERQVSAIHSFDKDEVWKAVHATAAEAVAKAQTAVADRSKELGIPDEFAPSLSMSWMGRGHNAWSQRRGELRALAKAEIAAAKVKAKNEIERMSIEAQSAIIAHGLESDAARAFLEALPALEKLMPALDLRLIEGRADERQHHDNRLN